MDDPSTTMPVPLHTELGYFLCVDAGGTKTAAAIADRKGRIVARGTGKSANMAEVGMERAAIEVIRAATEAIDSLCNSRDQPLDPLQAANPPPFARVWVGIAGCDSPQDELRMSKKLEVFFNGPVTVMNDGLLLSSPILRRGCPWGIAVVAGTGSVVVGVKVVAAGKVQQVVRRGGQGHLLGDHGSAYHIGITAVRFAADDFDFGLEREGGLAADIRDHYDVQSTADAPSRVHDLEPGLDAIAAGNRRKLRAAALAPKVMAAFTSSPPDPLAARVIRHCAKSLATDIAAVAGQAVARGGEPLSQAGLSVTGGVIKQAAYRQVLQDELHEMGCDFGWIEVVDDAAAAAAVALTQ